MTAIPGWAYIIIGILMSVFSKIVEAKTKPGAFALFFWLGIVFIVIGIGKYIFKAVFQKNKQETRHMPMHQAGASMQQHHQRSLNQQSQHSQHQQAQHQMHQGINPSFSLHPGQHDIHKVNQPTNQQQILMAEHPSIIACPLCGARHYDYANFCMKCGTRIKR